MTTFGPMDFGVLLGNIPVLFFFLGVLAVLVRSDLEVPSPLPKLFSLYLLLAIGVRGGVELSHSPWTSEVAWTMVAGVGAALLIPVVLFYALRRRLGPADAAGVAAAYGSVSAVTFVTATGFLDALGLKAGGHLVAVTALVESPSIIAAVALARAHLKKAGDRGLFRWGELLRESFFNGSILLLTGALVIGASAGGFHPRAASEFLPFTQGWVFQGVLCLFLLDLGINAARRFKDLRGRTLFLATSGLAIPLFNATLAMGLALLIGMTAPNAFLFTAILASASYIVVPAALRYALPEANPGVFLPMALAVTFPFNILVGLPLYWSLIQFLWGLG